MTSLNLTDLSILIVEPSDMQMKLIRNSLNDQGVKSIRHVKNGADVLLDMQRYEPDLVISSMYLPDMNATDLIKEIRETPSLEHVPFMLVSSETRFEQLDPIRQAGVVAILNKPFSIDDLHTALRATVEHLEHDELELDNFDIEHVRVLVVDDSNLARRHINRILNNFGMEQITEAENGIEAIKLLASHDFDLIVTDFNMPEMDGQQLIEHVRQNMGNTYTPILMITSENRESRLANIQQAGVSAICDKPFTPESIKTILYQILNEEMA